MSDDLSVYPDTTYQAPTPKLTVRGIQVDAPTLQPVGNGYNNPYYVATTNTGEHAADVYASEGQGVRLLGSDGSIIYEGTGPQAAQEATALANHISQVDGKNAAWNIQIENPTAPGQYQQAGLDTVDKKKSHGILGALLDIALPILANVILPGSGFLASAAAGAAGSAVSSAIQGRSLGDSLKAAALAGVGSGVGASLGAGSGASGALKGLTSTPSSLGGGLAAGAASLPADLSLAALPAGLTGTGSLLGALGAGAANELSPLIVQASSLAKGGLGVQGLVNAGIPQAVASAVTSDLANGIDPNQEVARYYPQDPNTVDPLTVEVPGPGAGSATTGAGVGAAAGDLLSPVEVSPQKGPYGNGLDTLNPFPGMVTQPDYSNLSVNNQLPDRGLRTPTPTEDATVLDPLVVSPNKGLDGLTTVPTPIEPPTDYSWLTPVTPAALPNDLTVPVVPPIVPAGGGGGGIKPVDLLPLAGAIGGGLGAGSPTGSTGNYTPVAKPPIFTATSPKFQLQPNVPRDVNKTREEWLKYAEQPETSFFTNVPIPHNGITNDLSVNLGGPQTRRDMAPVNSLAVQSPEMTADQANRAAYQASENARLYAASNPTNAAGQRVDGNGKVLPPPGVNPLSDAWRDPSTGATWQQASLGINPLFNQVPDSAKGGPTWQQNNYAANPEAFLHYDPSGTLVNDPQFGHMDFGNAVDPGWRSLPEQVTPNDLAIQQHAYDASQAAQKASDEINVRKALAGSGRTDYPGYDASLGYADGGFAVGPGDGRSDSIPARLSDGEYVMDAETVSLLGNGSAKAGAKALDTLRVNLRKHKGRELAKGEFSVKAKQPGAYMGGRV